MNIRNMHFATSEIINYKTLPIGSFFYVLMDVSTSFEQRIVQHQITMPCIIRGYNLYNKNNVEIELPYTNSGCFWVEKKNLCHCPEIIKLMLKEFQSQENKNG